MSAFVPIDRPTYVEEPPTVAPDFGPTRSWWLGLDRDRFAQQQRLEAARLRTLGAKAEPRNGQTSDSFGHIGGKKIRTEI